MAISTFKRQEIKFILDENQFHALSSVLGEYMNFDEYCVGARNTVSIMYTMIRRTTTLYVNLLKSHTTRKRSDSAATHLQPRTTIWYSLRSRKRSAEL